MPAQPRDEEEEEEGEPEDGGEDPNDVSGDESFATLAKKGPQTTPGSVGHPEECKPCTFYCFTRRGCNRGVECRFCHLAHQSKLQQRRESWKRQQREKRKAVRERVGTEGTSRPVAPQQRRNVPSVGGVSASAAFRESFDVQPYGGGGGYTQGRGLAAIGGQGQQMRAWTDSTGVLGQSFPGLPMAGSGFGGGKAPARPWHEATSSYFADEAADAVVSSAGPHQYSPSQAILTIGQFAEFSPPQTGGGAVHYRIVSPLPAGLNLDHATGIISGSATEPFKQRTVIVEAQQVDGPAFRASLILEVIDFTRGGFTIGHMDEFAPGRYMLVVHVPENEDEGEDAWGTKAAAGRWSA